MPARVHQAPPIVAPRCSSMNLLGYTYTDTYAIQENITQPPDRFPLRPACSHPVLSSCWRPSRYYISASVRPSCPCGQPSTTPASQILPEQQKSAPPESNESEIPKDLPAIAGGDGNCCANKRRYAFPPFQTAVQGGKVVKLPDKHAWTRPPPLVSQGEDKKRPEAGGCPAEKVPVCPRIFPELESPTLHPPNEGPPRTPPLGRSAILQQIIDQSVDRTNDLGFFIPAPSTLDGQSQLTPEKYKSLYEKPRDRSEQWRVPADPRNKQAFNPLTPFGEDKRFLENAARHFKNDQALQKEKDFYHLLAVGRPMIPSILENPVEIQNEDRIGHEAACAQSSEKERATGSSRQECPSPCKNPFKPSIEPPPLSKQAVLEEKIDGVVITLKKIAKNRESEYKDLDSTEEALRVVKTELYSLPFNERYHAVDLKGKINSLELCRSQLMSSIRDKSRQMSELNLAQRELEKQLTDQIVKDMREMVRAQNETAH